MPIVKVITLQSKKKWSKSDRNNVPFLPATATYTYTSSAYRIWVFIKVAKLVNDEKDQPAKDGHQKQHLRNELHKDVDVTLEVAVRKRR